MKRCFCEGADRCVRRDGLLKWEDHTHARMPLNVSMLWLCFCCRTKCRKRTNVRKTQPKRFFFFVVFDSFRWESFICSSPTHLMRFGNVFDSFRNTVVKSYVTVVRRSLCCRFIFLSFVFFSLIFSDGKQSVSPQERERNRDTGWIWLEIFWNFEERDKRKTNK